jgi:hypothetical protein
MAISTSGVSVPQLGNIGGVDSGIYQNAQPVKGMSISDMLDISGKSLELQKKKALLEPSIEAGKAQTELAQTQAKKAKLGLDTDFADKMRQNQIALMNDPLFVRAEQDPAFAKANLPKLHALVNRQKEAAIEMGLDPQKAEQLNAPYHVALDSSNGQGGRQFMKTRMVAGLDQQAQATLATPQYTTNAAGQIVGLTPFTNQIFAPEESGGQPQAAPQGGAPGQVQGQFTQRQSLNPGTAQAGMINTAATNLSTDFADTQKIASNSEPRVALFQNIKKLAPESFTGVGGARKELATGILNAVGIPAYEAEKMSTDELAKSSAMLALAGGNTDMARAMAEAANPNKKMNEGAIKQIADQMIGMERMNQAKYKFLSPAQTNPQEYANRLAQFNKVNDFRIFQESTPEQVRALKSSMSINEQKIMGEKIKLARSLGLL